MKRVKLKSVEPVDGPNKQYDINVQTNNNYFASGVLIHNCNIYSDGHWHARSVNTPYHPTREWAGRVAGGVGYQLPDGWKICAENLYGKHSIKYTDLREYVQVYGIVNDENQFLSWPDVNYWCELLDLVHVPVLWRGVFGMKNGKPYVRSYSKGKDDEYEDLWLEDLTEEDINDMAGREAEGYVMRTLFSFPAEDFEYHVGKWVRSEHVNTSEHWLREWEKNGEKNELL
jgi:hypothetical protein